MRVRQVVSEKTTIVTATATTHNPQPTTTPTTTTPPTPGTGTATTCNNQQHNRPTTSNNHNHNQFRNRTLVRTKQECDRHGKSGSNAWNFVKLEGWVAAFWTLHRTSSPEGGPCPSLATLPDAMLILLILGVVTKLAIDSATKEIWEVVSGNTIHVLGRLRRGGFGGGNANRCRSTCSCCYRCGFRKGSVLSDVQGGPQPSQSHIISPSIVGVEAGAVENGLWRDRTEDDRDDAHEGRQSCE